jgi:hypothetical protein
MKFSNLHTGKSYRFSAKRKTKLAEEKYKNYMEIRFPKKYDIVFSIIILNLQAKI